MFKGAKILITGGTGSFGKAFIRTLIHNYESQLERVVVFSRDELKQSELQQEFPKSKYDFMRYFIGDVKDGDRLKRAFEGVDYVVHAAALKQVPTAEYNPMEAIKTNIIGAENIVNAALDTDVKKVVALSTDKAAAPINLYGATKLCSDKLFVAGNKIKGNRHLQFSVVRYGNVMGSRGSVIPFFLKKSKEGVLPITHKDMTRFNISLQDGVNLVLHALQYAWGGEIFVPKIPSYRILDLAEAVCPDCEIEINGIRPGEKIHEEMITESDSFNTVDLGNYYAILPTAPVWNKEEYKKHLNATDVTPGTKYNSGTNDQWLNIDELRQLIKEHIDPAFSL